MLSNSDNIKICTICSATYRVKGQRRRATSIYCSIKCMGIHRKRIMPSTRILKNIKVCSICQKDYFIRGETRQLNSKTCSGQCYGEWRSLNIRGNKHPRWVDGSSSEQHALRQTPEYHSWRRSVYKKDNYTCQHCGAIKLELVAHHEKNFKEYPELRYEISNGITLCRACHKRVHKEIGMKTRFKVA